jgi:hypothetical protein
MPPVPGTMPPVPDTMPPVPDTMPPVPAISNQPEMSNEIEGMNIIRKFEYFSLL